MPIRLVLAEEHYLVREGVRRMIETEPELDLVASVSEEQDVKRRVKTVFLFLADRTG
ncbi:MAG: hypothetical protein ACR2MO_12260 [Acidimicrobiales bacterium]